MRTKTVVKMSGNTVIITATSYEQKPLHQSHPVLTAFLVNLLIGVLIFLPYIILGHGLFTIAYDFNAEQIPFNIFANDSIKSGKIYWSWATDLGSDFLTSYSFYNLGSPFFWLSLLFPGKWFPWLVGWFYMLKCGVSGMTSFLYFRTKTRNYSSALAACCMYAFSGFAACNIVFYHFHEVIAFFPLLLLGMDQLMEENRRGSFLFAVALNALVNYNFFVGEAIFCILYYLVRFGIAERNRKRFWRGIIVCAIEAILGVCIACVLFLPSTMMLMNNPKVSTHADWKKIFFDKDEYLLMFRGLFFPAESMGKLSVGVRESYWYSIAIYLPLIGPSLSIAYIIGQIRDRIRGIRKKLDWLTLMLLLCTVIALSYTLNSMFVGFTVEPYRRWYYMFLLFLCLSSAKVLDDLGTYPWKTVTLFCLAVSTLFMIFCMIRKELILNPRLFWVISILGILGYAISLWQFSSIRKGNSARMLIAFIGMSAVVTTALDISTYRSSSDFTNTQDYYNDVIRTGNDLQSDSLPYRYRFWDTYYNRALSNGTESVNSFNSTVEPSITEFYQSLLGGEGRHTVSPTGPAGTDELLGVKYYVTRDPQPFDENPVTIDNGFEPLYISENQNALPVGFVQHQYILKSDFQKIPVESRAIAMLNYLVVPDEEENLVSGTMAKALVDENTVYTEEDRANAVEAKRPESTEEASFTTKSFTCNLHAVSDGYAIFSVPYSDSWSCTVDGEQVSVLDTNGMMAVPVGSGDHEVLFTYRNKMREAGILITVLGLCASAVYVSVYHRREGLKKAADK